MYEVQVLAGMATLVEWIRCTLKKITNSSRIRVMYIIKDIQISLNKEGLSRRRYTFFKKLYILIEEEALCDDSLRQLLLLYQIIENCLRLLIGENQLNIGNSV